MSVNIEKQSKGLNFENMTLREELEKYREILIKFQNTLDDPESKCCNQKTSKSNDIRSYKPDKDDELNVILNSVKVDQRNWEKEEMMTKIKEMEKNLKAYKYKKYEVGYVIDHIHFGLC